MNERRLPLHARARRRPAERGFILIIGLLFMLVLLLLSSAMFRSFTVQEKIAGNTRDKQRSFEAAQSALQYAEWWLATGNATTPTACTASSPNQAIGSLAVCSNALATPSGDWTYWFDYNPANAMQVSATGGVDSTTGDINYQALPGIYVSYIGLTYDGLGALYQVTAFGKGGSYETRTVLQSTFKLQSATNSVMGP